MLHDKVNELPSRECAQIAALPNFIACPAWGEWMP
jgi:hypothetical protein